MGSCLSKEGPTSDKAQDFQKNKGKQDGADIISDDGVVLEVKKNKENEPSNGHVVAQRSVEDRRSIGQPLQAGSASHSPPSSPPVRRSLSLTPKPNSRPPSPRAHNSPQSPRSPEQSPPQSPSQSSSSQSTVDMADQESKLRNIFNQLDRDHSETIDVSELKVILGKMNLSVEHEDVLFLVSRYDDDNNGTLNFEEFSELILSIMAVKKKFDDIDADKNGSISAQEIHSHMANIGLSSGLSKSIINLFDEDASGAVEYREFVTLMFYLNELEYQYKTLKEKNTKDFTWIVPMLGPENSLRAPGVSKALQALKESKGSTFTLDEFARPIVQAVVGNLNPMGRTKKMAPRIKALHTRVRPPPKKVLKIKHHVKGEAIYNDGSLYCDPDFTPSELLLPVRMRSRVSSWRRMSEISSDAKLFVNGIEEGDVIQGALGDCWFLGALAVVATSTENFIEHLFITQKPQEGYYQCKFFKGGQWIVVTVDDRLPCDANGKLVFASCRDSTEFWVPIVEKAFAKLHGSYEALESGTISDALKDLTGEGVELVKLDADEFKAHHETAWNLLLHNIKGHFLMGCANDANLPVESELACGLLVLHAYSIIDVQEVQGNKLLRIRNPWGQGEWNGPWSDNAKEWTPALLKHFNYEFANDGTFFMCFEDFLKYYTRLYVLRMQSDSDGEIWNKLESIGEWKGESAAGCANHPAWLNNPQYALRVDSPNTKVFINLSQPDLRYVYKKSPATLKKEYDPIGMYVVKTKTLKYRKTSYQPSDKVATSAFTTVRDLSFEFSLPPGEYVVIPCTFLPGIQMAYDFCLYATHPMQLTPLTASMPTTTVASEWKGPSAGGCANNQATFLNNPQFLLVCSSPGTVEILLTQENAPNTPLEAIAIYAFASDHQERIHEIRSILIRPTTIIDLQTVSEPLKVEPNVNYIIVPTTFDAHKEKKFTISVATDTAHVSVFRAL